MTDTGPSPDHGFSLRLRVVFDGGMMLGPGKVELLERIRDTGSIAAAGRGMAMSYKRAWSLVEQLNAGFARPLVASARGGAKGGGAELTPEGAQVIAHYRMVEHLTAEAGAARLGAIKDMLKDMSDET